MNGHVAHRDDIDYVLLCKPEGIQTQCLVCKKTITATSKNVHIGMKERWMILRHKLLQRPLMGLHCFFEDHDWERSTIPLPKHTKIICRRCHKKVILPHFNT